MANLPREVRWYLWFTTGAVSTFMSVVTLRRLWRRWDERLVREYAELIREWMRDE